MSVRLATGLVSATDRNARYLQLPRDAPTRRRAAGGNGLCAVAATWALSHERVSSVKPLVVRLLNLLACYAPRQPAPHHPQRPERGRRLGRGRRPGLLQPHRADQQPQRQDSGGPEDLIGMYRLIQATTLAQLANDQRDTVRRWAAFLLQAALPASPSAWPTGPSTAVCPQAHSVYARSRLPAKPPSWTSSAMPTPTTCAPLALIAPTP